MINRVNGMSQADVNALMNHPSWLDQFAPSYTSRIPAATRLLSSAPQRFDGHSRHERDQQGPGPAWPERIQKQAQTATINGRINAGLATQNNLYNDVQRNDYF